MTCRCVSFVLSVLLLVCVPRTGLAATFVAGNGSKVDADNTSIAVTVTGVNTGNLVACLFKFEGGSLTVANISATDGTTTLTEDPDGVTTHAGVGDLHSLFMWLPASAGGNDTITVTSTSRPWKQLACGAFSYSGTIALDDSVSAGVDVDSGTATFTSPSMTISGSELVALGCYGNYATATIDQATTINGVAATGTFGNSDGTICWYRLVGSGFTGAAVADFTTVVTNNATMYAVGFEVTAGGVVIVRGTSLGILP